MKKDNFTYIPGGHSVPLDNMDFSFNSAYVTNSRLMGVLAIYACWTAFCEDMKFDLHQFFYIDCEEAGLESYKSFRGEFSAKAEMAEQVLVGGLGSEKMNLNEGEFRWLMGYWKSFNEDSGLPLPAGYDEYRFIFEKDAGLTRQAVEGIMSKICCPIVSDYQAVNYFLMRCFGRDFSGARFLTAPDTDVPVELYENYVKATFCKNTIDVEKTYGDGSVSYICDSLIEMNGSYDTVISRVVIHNLKVIGFEHLDSFHIRSAEAAMMLKKNEYVDVFEILLEDDELEENIGEFIVGLNTVMTRQTNGRLFMAFKSTNDHVNERVFMLSNDVRGVYFLTDYGQLLVMSNSQMDLRYLVSRLMESPVAGYLIPTARYEFLEPVIFEFVKSDFDDFEAFLGIDGE